MLILARTGRHGLHEWLELGGMRVLNSDGLEISRGVGQPQSVIAAQRRIVWHSLAPGRLEHCRDSGIRLFAGNASKLSLLILVHVGREYPARLIYGNHHGLHLPPAATHQSAIRPNANLSVD